jgi:hypothetical protein
MIVVILISLALCVNADTLCPAFVCDPDGADWLSGECAKLHPSNATQYDLRSGECASDQYCPALTLDDETSSVSCLDTPHVNPVPQQMAFPGEKCDAIHVCIGQGAVCVDGACFTTIPCYNVQDCSLGKFCSAGTCLPQVAVGGNCTQTTDCVNSAYCDIAIYGEPESGKCVKYGSVSGGMSVQTCDSSTTALAPHPLCFAGYCFSPDNNGTIFECAASIMSSSVPYRCGDSAGSFCSSLPDPLSQTSLLQSCSCGLDGFSYCPQFPNDPDYSALYQDIQTFLNTDDLSSCNTARHSMSAPYLTDPGWAWCTQKTLTDEQTYHYLRATHYAMVAMATDCVLKIVFPAYYEVLPW